MSFLYHSVELFNPWPFCGNVMPTCSSSVSLSSTPGPSSLTVIYLPGPWSSSENRTPSTLLQYLVPWLWHLLLPVILLFIHTQCKIVIIHCNDIHNIVVSCLITLKARCCQRDLVARYFIALLERFFFVVKLLQKYEKKPYVCECTHEMVNQHWTSFSISQVCLPLYTAATLTVAFFHSLLYTFLHPPFISQDVITKIRFTMVVKIKQNNTIITSTGCSNHSCLCWKHDHC